VPLSLRIGQPLDRAAAPPLGRAGQREPAGLLQPWAGPSRPNRFSLGSASEQVAASRQCGLGPESQPNAGSVFFFLLINKNSQKMCKTSKITRNKIKLLKIQNKFL
jgi:hypothetical protein